jgi:phosphoglycolate phosphatase-like HAD superfamily hydrolase
MQIAGAIFDLDGTVIDTLPIVIEAFRRAITMFVDRPFTDEDIIRLFGPNEAGVLRKVIPDHWQEGLTVYLNEYEALFTQRNIGPFPGIEDALHLLKNQGIRTAVVTGKGAYSTAFSLKLAHLDDYFDLVLTGSLDGPVKPRRIQEVLTLWAVPPAKVFYLGDSPSDIQDARTAEVIPLGAAWADLLNCDKLKAENPYAIFTTPQEFVDWISRCLT